MWMTQKRTSPARPISTVRTNIQMQQATLDNPCQLNATAGGTMPCVESGHVQNVTFIEVVRHKAGSWLSLCSGSLTKMTVFHIVTGGQR